MQIHEITPALAHVVHRENLLVQKVWASGTPGVFHSEFVVDGTHPYLYENSGIANHVSGTTFIDVGRQLLKSISHLFYGVPLESRFVLHDVRCEFMRWAKLGVPIRIQTTLEGGEGKSPKARRTFRVESVLEQEGIVVGKLLSSFTTLSMELEERLMTRQYAESSRASP